MKKLIVGAVALAMSAATYAGSVNWTLSNLSTSSGDPDASGYLCYFLIDSGAGYSGSTYSQASAIAAIGDSSKDLSFLDDNGIFGMWGGAAASDSGSAFDMSTGDGYFADDATGMKGYLVILNSDVLADATKAYVTNLEDVKTSMGGGDVAFDASTSSDPKVWMTIGNVPEPTSGLLLLLGVAGLALRRRRA